MAVTERAMPVPLRFLRGVTLGRCVPPPTGRANAFGNVLNERDESLPLEWERNVGEDRALQRRRKNGCRSLPADAVENESAARRERNPQCVGV